MNLRAVRHLEDRLQGEKKVGARLKTTRFACDMTRLIETGLHRITLYDYLEPDSLLTSETWLASLVRRRDVANGADMFGLKSQLILQN